MLSLKITDSLHSFQTIQVTFQSRNKAMDSLMSRLTALQAFKRLTPTLDRCREPRKLNSQRICICVLGTSSRHLDLLLEGGDICPGDVMVVLSPDWLQREALEEKPQQILLVKKALTFERGGSSYLDVFEPPRRVTYLINEMPESFDPSGLDCAMNGSNSVASRLEDRLLWRMEISKMKVSLPPCIVLHGDLSPGFKHDLERVTELRLVERPQREDKEDSFERDISELLSTVPMTTERKFIIGKRISGSFQKETVQINEESILKGLSEVWQGLRQDEYITIETTRSLPKLQTGIITSNINDTPQDRMFSVCARLTVCRGLDDHLIFSKISASATLTSRPDSFGSVYKDLATCLIDLGYTDQVCLQQVEESMKKQARAVMNRVVDLEKSYAGSYIGPRTDYLELTFDVMLLREVMTPVLSDVSNQHTCLDTWGDNSNGLISPARSILHVLALRSHNVLLSGKTLLYLLDENFVDVRIEYFKDLKKFGNKIIVITPHNSPQALKYVDELIEYDLSDGTNYTQYADDILKLLHHKGIQISGCISLGDNYGLVASKLRHLLDLPGVSLEATKAANEKYLTYSKLWGTPSARYSSEAFKMNNSKDLEIACRKIHFPAFVKMDAGGAIGARIVTDEDDCKRYMTYMDEKINNNEKECELINGKLSFVLTELLQGDEYIIDVALFQGQFIAGFIRLAVPTNPPYFTCRVQAFPAQLSADKEASLLRAAHQMCYDLGLKDGVINVEVMDTEEGPKLIEINGRIGGHGVPLFAKHCLDEDMFMMNNLIHAGIRPTVVALPPQRMGFSLLLSLRHHSHLVGDETFKAMIETLQKRNMVLYQTLRPSIFNTVDKVMTFLAVVEEDMETAKTVLLTIAKGLGLDTAGFPCADLLDSVSMRNGIKRPSN